MGQGQAAGDALGVDRGGDALGEDPRCALIALQVDGVAELGVVTHQHHRPVLGDCLNLRRWTKDREIGVSRQGMVNAWRIIQPNLASAFVKAEGDLTRLDRRVRHRLYQSASAGCTAGQHVEGELPA